MPITKRDNIGYDFFQSFFDTYSTIIATFVTHKNNIPKILL